MAGQLGLKAPLGGTITLNPADTGSNFVVTIPANAGTVLTTASTFGGTGPAFSATATTGTSTATNTFTKLTFNVEEFDTNNNFASSRFTPTVAGYYQINAAVGTTGYYPFVSILIYKNGSVDKYGYTGGSTPNTAVLIASSLVFLNGSTDYVEIYWVQTSGATVTSGATNTQTFFNGAMVRSA